METGLRTAPAPTASAGERGVWQYRLVRVPATAAAAPDAPQLQGVLDAEGRDGWQLSAIVPTAEPTDPGGMRGFGWRAELLLVFARPAVR